MCRSPGPRLLHLLASLADLALARGDYDGAERRVAECLELATRTESQRYVVRSWRVRGRIALAGRRWDAAEHALGEAFRVARLIRNPTQLWRSHADLARLCAARGQDDLAHVEWSKAKRVVEERREHAANPEIRSALASLLAPSDPSPDEVGVPGRDSAAAANLPERSTPVITTQPVFVSDQAAQEIA
jgi:uncharacterized protein HemY